MTKRTELFLLRSSAGKRVLAFNLSDALITINVPDNMWREKEEWNRGERFCRKIRWRAQIHNSFFFFLIENKSHIIEKPDS